MEIMIISFNIKKPTIESFSLLELFSAAMKIELKELPKRLKSLGINPRGFGVDILVTFCPASPGALEYTMTFTLADTLTGETEINLHTLIDHVRLKENSTGWLYVDFLEELSRVLYGKQAVAQKDVESA